jgi:hypothetical protein
MPVQHRDHGEGVFTLGIGCGRNCQPIAHFTKLLAREYSTGLRVHHGTVQVSWSLVRLILGRPLNLIRSRFPGPDLSPAELSQ